jgi:hypothetical protein
MILAKFVGFIFMSISEMHQEDSRVDLFSSFSQVGVCAPQTGYCEAKPLDDGTECVIGGTRGVCSEGGCIRSLNFSQLSSSSKSSSTDNHFSHCILAPPVAPPQQPSCGDGIVQLGEICDPGDPLTGEGGMCCPNCAPPPDEVGGCLGPNHPAIQGLHQLCHVTFCKLNGPRAGRCILDTASFLNAPCVLGSGQRGRCDGGGLCIQVPL